MSATIARPQSVESAHWYTRSGEAVHTVKCTTKDGDRPTTIADARKLGLLPSVTNILRVLHKPALESWKIEQACLSVLTAPRGTGEELDAFVQRVLHDERQHEQEAAAAADLGTRIHKALEDELSGRVAEHEMLPWIEPVWEWLNKRGYHSLETEKVVIGNGYGGRLDLHARNAIKPDVIWDFKTTRKPPKESYWEHKIQIAAYANACGVIRGGNIYISTAEPGYFVVDEHTHMAESFEAFQHLLAYWQIANDYRP